VKYIWNLHFTDAIPKNIQIGIDYFVFKYPVTCKKIQIFIIFIDINLNDCFYVLTR